MKKNGVSDSERKLIIELHKDLHEDMMKLFSKKINKMRSNKSDSRIFLSVICSFIISLPVEIFSNLPNIFEIDKEMMRGLLENIDNIPDIMKKQLDNIFPDSD